MIILEKIHTLTDEETQTLNFFLGNDFPLYYISTTPNYYEFVHTFMLANNGLEGKENSPWASRVKSIFHRFCESNDIKYDTILRAAVNCSVHKIGIDGKPYGDIHVDHKFTHYNFIMYLNDCSGDTYLFDGNSVKQIEPRKNKVAIFKGIDHAQGFCKMYERRVVLVVTFTSEFLNNINK